MKILKSNNKVPLDILVDDNTYLWAHRWKWSVTKRGYVKKSIITNGKRHELLLHRLVMCDPEDKQIDHKDRNKLNCQEYNLRICTQAQNTCNRSSKRNSSSIYLGVCWIKKDNRWRASIKTKGKLIWIGHYKNERDAAIAYNNAARIHHGEFANLNVL